jgi:hypothetical protein
LDKTFPRAISIGFLGYLGMMHYYMESFTWKSGSPYRKYIAFAVKKFEPSPSYRRLVAITENGK